LHCAGEQTRVGEHDAEQVIEIVRHARRDLPDCIKSLQLLNGGFGRLPLNDLRAQRVIGLFQLPSSCFNAVLERFLDTFSIGDIERDAIKPNGLAILEMRLATCRDPTLSAVVSEHPIFTVMVVALHERDPLERGGQGAV
jgi:hypothetical protein